ncbi:MAG: Ig-like domain-containing protein [Gemmatimonadales bacterium]
MTIRDTLLQTGDTVGITATLRGPCESGALAPVAFRSSKPEVASVDSAGLVTGLTPGSTVIRATWTRAGASFGSAISVTVVAAVASVRLEPAGPASLALGSSFLVRLTATSPGGRVSSPAAEYRSSDAAVLAVSDSGLVTGLVLGSAYVIGELTSGGTRFADSVLVSVGCTTELTQVLDPPGKVLQIGESFAPTVRLLTCGGRVALTDSVWWRSADSTVAAVEGDQVVRGIRAGTTMVRPVTSRYPNLGGLPVTVVP